MFLCVILLFSYLSLECTCFGVLCNYFYIFRDFVSKQKYLSQSLDIKDKKDIILILDLQ